MELTSWLAAEIDRKGWSLDVLDHKAGLSPGTASKVMSGTATAGWEFCLKVSWALDVSPEMLFHLAGLLPDLPTSIKEEIEAISLLRSLPPDIRSSVMTILSALAG